jgi:beta-glucosidase-like glycosyl hydrolase
MILVVTRRPEYDPLVDDLSVERRAAQLVVPVLDLRKTEKNDPDESYAQAEKWLDDLGVGGFLLFGGDERAAQRLRALKRPGRGPAGVGPIIASDLERGVGQQVKGATDLPPLMALGAANDEDLARQAGSLTGREARSVGIDWVFAPCLDLADLPENPIIQARAFGSDPALVKKLGIAWIQGLEEEGALACAKHFPGHGATTLDSHDALPKVVRPRELFEARDLAPFEAAAALPVASFMTAHVAYPSLASELPSTIEPAIVEGILRKKLRYDGLVVTDALIMSGLTNATGGDETRAAVLALEAGCDVLLFPKDPRAVVRTIAAWARTGGQTARARLQDALGRVLHVKRQLGLAGPAHHLKTRKHHVPLEGPELARRIAEAAITRVGPARPALQKGEKTALLVLDDDGIDHPALELTLELQEALGPIHVAVLGPQATDEDRARAREIARSAQRVVAAVLCRTRAWKNRPGLAPAHRDFLLSLEAATVVGLCTPYALAGACRPGSEVLVAYGDDGSSQRAAARVLLGARAQGTLPVEKLDFFAK